MIGRVKLTDINASAALSISMTNESIISNLNFLFISLYFIPPKPRTIYDARLVSRVGYSLEHFLFCQHLLNINTDDDIVVSAIPLKPLTILSTYIVKLSKDSFSLMHILRAISVSEWHWYYNLVVALNHENLTAEVAIAVDLVKVGGHIQVDVG
jgi:hypothetical protein